MISFNCPGCSQRIQIGDDLSGQKIKCPNCGEVTHVPSPVLTVAFQSMTSPVAPDSPRQIAPDQETHPPVGESISPHPGEARSDKELCNFLAPPQNPDELGRLGAYRVLKVLGQGGMGVVFLAEDTHLERKVALKAMKPVLAASESAKKRFLREAKTTASIKHDHIVTIYQVGEDRGVPFLAMEFLEGESLDDRIKREEKLPIAEVLRIGKEIAEGLAQAHERGLIHRDIKPANIWLEGKRRRVKILDFGLARAAEDEVHLTKEGAIIGTPAYMAPEQARSEPVDYRCDLFSLGCIIYRLCTGKVAFKGRDTIATLMAVTTEMPKPPIELNGDVPLALSELVMKLLAKEKTERPTSAGVVIAQLEAIEGMQLRTCATPPNQQRRSFSQSEKNSETAAYEPPPSSLDKPTPRPWLRRAYYALGAAIILFIAYAIVLNVVLYSPRSNMAEESHRLQQRLLGKWYSNDPPPEIRFKGAEYDHKNDYHEFRPDGTLRRWMLNSRGGGDGGYAETVAYEVVDGNHISLHPQASPIKIVVIGSELTIFYSPPEGIRRFVWSINK